MKSFRKIVSEVAQPKAGDEKHFKDKHIVTKVDYPVDVEDQFTGGKIAKAPKRKADHEAGEDEKVYEAIDPVNKKAALGKFKHRKDKDIDNDGDVDSSDKYLHARRNAVTKAIHKEEVEELDEISRDTARSYINKASAHKTTGETPKKDRSSGVELAGKKAYGIGGKAKVNATEEVEQIDELSKKTLGSYVKKATGDAVTKAYKAGDVRDKDSGKNYMKALGRQIGISKATTKLAKEEVEELDEISKKTLGSYVKKASYDAASNAAKFGANEPDKKGGSAFVKAHNRLRGITKATDRLTKEEVEQLDELSPNTLHSYIKKAAGNMAGNAAVAAAQASSSMKKSSPDVKRKIKNRMQGITGASGRLADKANMSENAWEEVPMMMRQLQFIAYASEEIMDYLNESVDPEEWFQNKLAHVHDQMQTLHAYAEGDRRMMTKMDRRMYGEYSEEAADVEEVAPKMKDDFIKTQREKDRAHDAAMGRTPTGRKKTMTSTQRSMAAMRKEETDLDEATPTKKAITRALQGMKVQPKEKVTVKKAPWEKNEEVDLDESITKMSHGRLKFHLNTNTPHGSYSNDEMKSERDRRLKSGAGEAYRKAKAGLSEVTQTAIKKTVTYIDPKGHSRTRNVPVKRIDKDERGQDKIRESVEMLDEAFKVGMVKLKDGGSVVLKKEDADLLNKMFKDLSTANRKKMQEVAMKDKSGFEEILGFAREAI